MFAQSIDQLRTIGSTNTQTRRLGYVVQVCRIAHETDPPQALLQRYLEDWAQENNQALASHISDKGILNKSARSYGAKRYIQLAQDLQLVIAISGHFRPTITGRVLLELDGVSNGDNPFELTNETASLLFYQLLLLDGDYMLPTLRLSGSVHTQGKVLKTYQGALCSRFEAMESSISSPSLRSEFNERRRSITEWTKPKAYAEHIALPRLHWLLDLRLLDWSTFRTDRHFRQSTAGADFLAKVPRIGNHPFVTRKWCQNLLLPTWSHAFDIKYERWSSLSEKRQATLTEEYVELGFQQFHTQTRLRISAYQAILFMLFKLLSKERILAQFEEMKRAVKEFSSSGSFRWRFYWSTADSDGYLQLVD